MVIQKLSSRIDSVKIYAAGATITRIAQLNITTVAELPTQIEIAELPLALDDSSVRVRAENSQGNTPIASDIRIGLAVPLPPETPNSPPDEEWRAAKNEVTRIEDIISLIDNEINVLNQLQVPERPDVEAGKAPPPSPMSARLALANFSDEQIRLKIQEKRDNLEKLAKAKENLADLEQQKALASTARNAKPEELRKTVIVSLSYADDKTSYLNKTIQLVVEYFVPGARWTPTYVCRLNSVKNQATIAVRALICQRTGEDWSSVKLELSTANPIAWCGIPELSSLRLGKMQPEIRKVGWRQPPVGAEILFEDFDRQKKSALPAISIPLASFLSNLKINFNDQILSFQTKNPQEDKDYIFYELEKFLEGKQEDEFALYEEDLSWDSSKFTAEISELYCLSDMAESDSEFADLFDDYSEPENDVLAELEKFKPVASKINQSLSYSNVKNDFFAYSLMRMGASDNLEKRGQLSIETREKAYLEILQNQKIVVTFNILKVVQQAVSNAQECLSFPLPPGGIYVRNVAGAFDYAYSADGRIDIPSDGQFHSVALTSKTTDVDVRYIVVPREDTNVFRIAQLRNPLAAPLLKGPADVYVDGEYILSTNIATVPPKGQMELGLGIEQAIKVARNTSYSEARSGQTIVAFNELRHQIKIEIKNHLSRDAKIEVRERLPIPEAGAKVEVEIEQVSPEWQPYNQHERGKTIRGGHRWRVIVPAKKQKTLSVDYKIKTFVDNELIGGNRRE